MIHKNIREKKFVSLFSVFKIGTFKENGDSSGKDNKYLWDLLIWYKTIYWYDIKPWYKNMVSYLYKLGLHWLQVAENSVIVLNKQRCISLIKKRSLVDYSGLMQWLHCVIMCQIHSSASIILLPFFCPQGGGCTSRHQSYVPHRKRGEWQR